MARCKGMRIVVVTALTAGRGSLQETQETAGADWVAFCDEPLLSRVWEVRPASDLFHDPARNARIHKLLPHLYFPEYDYSLWLDSNLELRTPVRELVETYLVDADAAFLPHPHRRCLYEEAAECARLGLEDPQVLAEQVERYRREGFPTGAGLFQAGAILRRHCPAVARFNEVWWAELCRFARRDQVSGIYAALRTGLRWTSFAVEPGEASGAAGGRQVGPHFRSHPHAVGEAGGSQLPGQWPEAPPGDRGPLRALVIRQQHLEAAQAQAAAQAQEAERYARSLEEEIARRDGMMGEAERYVASLREELGRRETARADAERYALSLERAVARLRRPWWRASGD